MIARLLADWYCCFAVITYLYIRTLSMNRKLVARRAVEKMSQVKSSFIQHITHETTPLNLSSFFYLGWLKRNRMMWRNASMLNKWRATIHIC